MSTSLSSLRTSDREILKRFLQFPILLERYSHLKAYYYLPDTDDGIGDENEEDDKGLNESSDGLITVFEERENL